MISVQKPVISGPQVNNKKSPLIQRGPLLKQINVFYAFTFPFTFAITSSATLVGAGA